jgi:hypothetical protein
MATTTGATPNIPMNTLVRMGYSAFGGAEDYFTGWLDEFAIWDCVEQTTVFNPNDSGVDSLRQAIADVCPGGTITFDSSLSGATINLASTLTINKDLTIDGSALASRVSISGQGAVRVFSVNTGITATLNNLIITKGNTTSGGGGIYTEGILTLNNCLISDNYSASQPGGGIFNNSGGELTVNNSTLSNNVGEWGGGIENYASTVTVRSSTFITNRTISGANGGGMDSWGGSTALVVNSTFTGNSARERGGGILNYGSTMTVINSTLSANSGPSGGSGIANFGGGTLHLSNTLIANSAAGTDCYTDSNLATNVNNLIEDDSCSPALTGDPNLAALADNGGATQTMALLSGSPAIDAGDATTCASAPVNKLDQRGVTRPQGSACDIGAYEYIAVAPILPVGLNGNGPGGVGITDGTTPLELWLQADSGVINSGSSVSTWTDQSGNNNNATQGHANLPTNPTGVLNGQPVVRFDGSDQLELPRMVQDDFSILAVFSTLQNLGGSGQWYYGAGLVDAEVGGFTNDFGMSIGGGYINTGVGSPDVTIASSNSYNNGNGHIAAFHRTKSSGQISQFVDGSSQGTRTGGTQSLNVPSRIVLGSLQTNNNFFNGDIAEVVIYSSDLNDVQRILVENYLAAKYALDISAGGNDLYDGDTTGNGNFDLNVAGIGQLGGNQHTAAHAAGMILQNSTFLKDDGDWFLFGHNTPTNSTTNTDLPAGLGSRWSRSFYVSKTDAGANTGTVDIAFDYSDGGLSGSPANPAGSYRLLSRSDVSGQFTDITATSGAMVTIVGDQVIFSGVDVSQLSGNITLGETGAAEMAVLGNSQVIVDGDTTPSTADDTDFDSVTLGGTPIAHTFTISNSGTADLTLSGTPAVTLTTGTHFTVTQPTSTTLKADETTTFTVTFDPQSAGDFTDTVNIANNDSDENPYTFVISGTGQALPVNLSVSTNSGTEAAETVVTVTATASANVSGDQSVSLSVSGTDITGGDYVLSSSKITIFDGQASGSVTFTVQNDTVVEGDETATLTLGKPSAGLTLGATTSQDVALTDNDVQYTIEADLTSVVEGDTGSTPLTFTVTRSGAYTSTSGTVSFSLGGTAGSGSDYNNVSPASLVEFETTEISTTITMDVLGDYVDENVESIDVTLNSPTVSGNGTAALGTATAQTSINDDDNAGVTVTPTSGLVTHESGLTDTFTIVLASQPTATVTIDLSSSDTDEGTVSPTSVSFTTLNWNEPQTITITGVDDSPPASDGNIAYTIVTAAASSSDSTYNNMNPGDIEVTNNDNDTPGFTISPTSGLTTTEAGGQATFTVVLNTQPTAVVTLPVSSGDTGEGTVSPTSVSFTTLNWNEPQTVTITGEDDGIADGDQAYTIITGDPTSSDGGYNGAGANPSDVSVTNEDNDTPGFTISAISGDTSEDGDTATFTIRLNTEPTGNVVIDTASSNTGEGTASPGQLTFTSLNWSKVQTVTVTGVDDGDNPDREVSYTIQLTVNSSTAATEYFALDPADVEVANQDNDVPPIFLPLIIKGFAPGPDLIVDDVVATGSKVTVTIRNVGNTATSDDFWVDVYFDPTETPTVNHPWDTIAGHGAAWGVTTTLDPGESLNLVTGDQYHYNGSNTFPAGADVYAYVDSINYATTTGNIQENNEDNNVYGPVVSITGSGGLVAPATAVVTPPGLPKR